MNKNLKLGIIKVFAANILNLVFSLGTNFLLPKYLSFQTYAGIKTYQLYIAYIGILTFGYVDGTYLEYGGKNIYNLGKSELVNDIYNLHILETLISGIFIVCSIFIGNSILIAFSLTILSLNMIGYYKSLFQAIGEFELYGKIMNFTTGITFCANMLLIFVLNTDFLNLYLGTYTVINAFIWLFLETYAGRRIESGKYYKQVHISVRHIIYRMKSGISLMLGNLSTIVLTSMDRAFVNFFLPVIDFAQYSFAVSIDNFLNVAITPLTVTLYNYFCTEKDKDKVVELENIIALFGTLIVSAFFGAKFIVENFLGAYIGVIRVMCILFATQILNIVIKSIYINLYKANRRQNKYFMELIIILAVGLALNCLFYLVMHSKESFAWATFVTTIIWFAICYMDNKEFHIRTKTILHMLISSSALILLGFNMNAILGFAAYLIIIFASAGILLNNTITVILEKLKGRIYISKK